ncbi:MAG: insulinase family protein [Tissierellia bacterium]|nr:insulinase family protein [Tissierellia bacterium]
MNIKNYKLIEKRQIDDIKSTVYWLEHEKTRANVLYISNSDDNKTFGIGFKTTPHNSKGMAHIMEHSVLNGSKKYTTKEPFMDMLSSSLQTFLNAMTFPDKTIFPVSSRNDKDFRNLMDVYLDAVFNPLVYKKEEIFLQEGWHFETKDDNINYSGVVYNEMKGAMSDPESQAYAKITQYLYKGSTYEYNSGGDPYEITKLSYEEFLDFHKKFYHPSNSYIFLYGDMDLKEILEYIDNDYLSNYEYKKIESNTSVKLNNYKKIIEEEYSIADGEDEKDKDFLSLSFMTVDGYDIEKIIAQSVIVSVLFNMETSKIKQEFYKEKLGGQFYAISGYGEKSSITIIGKNSSIDKIDDFVNLINDNLEEIVQKGIDKNELKAAFNKIDFSLREELNSSTKGVEYFITAFKTWLYDKNPIDSMEILKVLDRLRSKINTDYFENFIKEYLLDNDTKLIITIKAKSGLNKNKDIKEKEKLKQLQNSLDKDKLKEIKEKEEKLNKYQNSENTEEEKKTLPKLDINDIDTKVEVTNRNIEKDDNITYLYHNLDSSNIIYETILFDIDHIEDSNLAYVSLLDDLLGSIDTKNHKYTEIENIINLNGGLYFKNRAYWNVKLKTTFSVNTKAIGKNLENITDITKDILFNSDFSNKDRILDLVKRIRMDFEDTMYDTGHTVTMLRNKAHYSQLQAYNEHTMGIEYLIFLKNLEKEIEKDYNKIKAKLEQVYSEILNSKNIIVDIVSNESEYEFVKKQTRKITDSIEKKDYKKVKRDLLLKDKKEAIITSANVQYISKGFNIKEKKEFNANEFLIASILNNLYLYKEIRAKGGAYGAGIKIDRLNNITTYSYRDPNLKETIKIYDEMGKFLDEFNIDKRQFDDLKISTIGILKFPQSVRSKALLDLSMYMTGRSYEKLEKYIKDIKASDTKDIKDFKDSLDFAMSKNYLTVFGNKDKILENKELFDSIININ